MRMGGQLVPLALVPYSVETLLPCAWLPWVMGGSATKHWIVITCFFMFHIDLARQPVPRYQDAGQWGSCSHPAHAMYTRNSLSLQMFSVSVKNGKKWGLAPCFFGGRRCWRVFRWIVAWMAWGLASLGIWQRVQALRNRFVNTETEGNPTELKGKGQMRWSEMFSWESLYGPHPSSSP